MSRITEVEKEVQNTATLVKLTSIFEGIASLKIAKIKGNVMSSTAFFRDLWNIYSKLRVDATFRYGREHEDKRTINKELIIIITAEGGFSGDIDQKLINWMIKNFDENKNEVIVIGHHGAVQLSQRGFSYKKYFKLPEQDQNINVEPIIRHVQQYSNCIVYYQQYVSLMVQDVKRIELVSVVKQIGSNVENTEEIISENNYIFEPSTYGVVSHLERSMMQIALSQLILESKLAQYASRFRAMSASHQAADDMLADKKVSFNRSKRAVKDERLKEIVNGLRKSGARAA